MTTAAPAAQPGSLRRWVLAARVRTLPAAVVPVAVGTAAVRPVSINWINAALCVVVALALQIATNFANDYSDGVRGTDDGRVGPFRLTASGLVAPVQVRRVAISVFAVAGVAGVALAARSSWWLVAVGATAMAAGWFYTGGPKPYGYYGFGELFVFVYFGLVATVGSSYVQHLHVPTRSWWLAAAAGAAACTLLEANNLRDVDGDQAAGKKTLAARLGRENGAWLYAGFAVVVAVTSATGSMNRLWAAVLFAVGAAVLYAPAVKVAFSPRRGRELIGLLVMSARLQLVIGLAMTVAVCFVH